MLKKQRRRVVFRVCCFLLATWSFFPQVIFAAENKQVVDSNSKQEIASVFTEERLQTFVDNYMEDEMREQKIAGAVIVVVKDGHEVLKKGYGFSDIANETPVDPDITTFPIASVSKLFTATAIMQLYERGQIDLDEDVQNQIGDLVIENPYTRKVTCSNLLTHSSGLDEGSELFVGTTDKKAIQPQDTYFRTHHLNVVEEPDKVSRYSNAGYNLLGYIIERKSGQSYAQFVQENILEPLSMHHTTVAIDDENMSKGYEIEGESFKEAPFAYQYALGSGSIISTAEDMSHFLNAYLAKGSYGEQRILQEETVDLMEKKRFANDDILAGMGYGFIREERNGHLILKHEGALPGYMSTVLMIPEANVGIYLSVNTFKPLPFCFEEEFLEQFLPRAQQSVEGKEVDNLREYTGVYRNYDGVSQSTLMKVCILFDSTTDTKVELDEKGQLWLKEYDEKKERNVTHLIPIGNDRFIREDGKGYYAFRREEDGTISYGYNEVSHNASVKIHEYERKEVLWFIIISSFLVYVIDLVVNIRILLKKKKWYGFETGNILSGACMLFGFWGTVAFISVMVIQYDYHLVDGLKICLTMLLIGSVWVIIRLPKCMWQKCKHYITARAFVYQLGVCIISLLYIGLMGYCQLMGWRIS